MGAKLATLKKQIFEKNYIYQLFIVLGRTFVLVISLAPAMLPAAADAPRRPAAPAAPLAHPPGQLPEDLTATPLEMTMTAELEQQQTVGGRAVLRLLPAEHVVPGDTVIYTVEVRNTGNTVVSLPQFVAPIPEHTSYVADSAVGPGADISYSADGGQTFDRPENLRVHGAGGALRAAVASDYTHIRWTLRHGLKPHSVVYARFHARLN
jgi:uncharacterized repeat protein (TIGR01451 family)